MLPAAVVLWLATCMSEAVPSSRPKIIGVGLSETGTHALRAALELMDVTAIVHGDESFVPYMPTRNRYVYKRECTCV